jgi:hypothetical protein
MMQLAIARCFTNPSVTAILIDPLAYPLYRGTHRWLLLWVPHAERYIAFTSRRGACVCKDASEVRTSRYRASIGAQLMGNLRGVSILQAEEMSDTIYSASQIVQP